MAGERVHITRGPLRAGLRLATLFLLALAAGCKATSVNGSADDVVGSVSSAPVEDSLFPSNHRDWSPDLAVLPYAEFHGDVVTVRNIRNCAYESDSDYVVEHYDRSFDLRQIQSVDFLVVPFLSAPSLAHTMLSFGFADGRQLGVSVEARLEQGETYSPFLGSLRQYELMYVVADERDVIVRRTLHRATDVYLYPTVATPQQAREMFVDVMRRVNKLYVEPEFYDTLTNNCTTNIVRHVNRLRPGKVPYDPRVFFSGLSDQLAFQLGLIRAQGTFEQTRQRANITQRANRFADRSDFSVRIRR